MAWNVQARDILLVAMGDFRRSLFEVFFLSTSQSITEEF
jgi:hypothetical protein